jgi:chromosome segregation protein
VQGDLETAEAQRQSACELLAEKQQNLEDTERRVAQLEEQLETESKRLKGIESRRQEHNRLTTQAQIELAKSEQRLRGLRAAKVQCEQTRQERELAISECVAQLESCHDRYRTAELDILRTQAELAQRYLKLEASQELARTLSKERVLCQRQRSEARETTKRLRDRRHQIEQRQHERELAAEQVRHDRRSLAERLRDDYGIEIGQLDQPTDEEQDHERAEVDEEITSLRRKISNVGAVNLEALEELEDLDERFQSLSNQYQDLQAAKLSLERIITKINTDSRRLFAETLEAVRANFRTMFRKVFGGGSADIVLEDESDILESGIEVIANPPGKQSLSITLLSGGERALTAVTLLLALFQFRPSPFCVLDEVDGPLDEANIGRFVDVLKGFLGWTRFVIVTHSKKTMTAATTLYGVTMQESGVSKRVSVRFEDVRDSGHINPAAIERDQDEPAVEEDERGAA